MRLYVTNTAIEPSFDQVVLSVEEFCDISNHPYIASGSFDIMVIDLEDKIPSNLLKACIGKFKIIPKLTHPVTVDTVRLLAELYREKGAMLRQAWLRNKSSVQGIVDGIAEEFHWADFY